MIEEELAEARKDVRERSTGLAMYQQQPPAEQFKLLSSSVGGLARFLETMDNDRRQLGHLVAKLQVLLEDFKVPTAGSPSSAQSLTTVAALVLALGGDETLSAERLAEAREVQSRLRWQRFDDGSLRLQVLCEHLYGVNDSCPGCDAKEDERDGPG